MGMAGILVMWQRPFVQIFIPVLSYAFTRISVSNDQTIFEKTRFNLGDCNEYTQYTIFNIKQKPTQNYSKYNKFCRYVIVLLGTQERVQNSRGLRAIGVRATEDLLYYTE